MNPIGYIRAAGHRRRFERLAELYGTNRSPEEIDAIQLRRFNESWQFTCRHSKYFARLKLVRGLPDGFASWQQFEQSFPILDRSQLRECARGVQVSSGQPDYLRITGGTTSEPLQIPAWRHEDRVTELDTWYGRSWFQVQASDRLFLLWGHSHLLGKGLTGWWNTRKRRCLDVCLGYKRQSAYDLGTDSLRAAGEALLRFRPRYVIGYSVGLHRLAHANRHLSHRFKALGLKVVVATGESFPGAESVSLLTDVFGCPVAMEYGAVETGIIAHQRPDGGFQVFWNNNRLEGLPSSEIPGAYELLITTLYPRMVPLIRYRIGDLAIPASDAALNAGFQGIVGRCNDCIEVGEGALVHSEAFTHVLRDIRQIQAFQVEQNAGNRISVSYLAEQPLPGEILHRLRERLSKVDHRLRVAHIQHVDRLLETRAGKTKRIVNRTSTETIA